MWTVVRTCSYQKKWYCWKGCAEAMSIKQLAPKMHVDASGHMGHYYIQEDAKSNVYKVEERLGV